MNRVSLLILLFVSMIGFTDCDDNDRDIEVTFNEFTGKVLGYAIEGQEEKWGNQKIILLSIYTDALVFNENDSLTLSYIGFGYGNDGLTHYMELYPNIAYWQIEGEEILISVPQYGWHETWKILSTTSDQIVFRQSSTKEVFYMKVMK